MIEKATFNNKLSKLEHYTLQEKLDIQNAKRRYPYCSLLQTMDLLSDKAASIYQWNERFTARTALHVPNVKRLLSHLDKVKIIDISTPDDLKLKQEIEQAKAHEFAPMTADQFDVLDEINSYQEISFKTAPKSVILKKFLEESNVNPSDIEEKTADKGESNSKKGNKVPESLETETLAVILTRQKKYDKAIEVYQKLMTKIPEKSSTFATEIQKLKQKIQEIDNTKSK